MNARTRQPATLVFGTVVRGCLVPGLAALALALGAARASRIAPAGDLGFGGTDASGPLLLWLHLPCAVVAAIAVVLTMDAWPLFGRARDGRPMLRRLTRTALDGCGMATAGGTAAAALLLAGVGATFAVALRLVAEVEPPRTWTRALAAPGRATLDADTRTLHLHASGVTADAVRINPLAVFTPGQSLAGVELTLTIDGEVVAARCTVRGNGEQAIVQLPAARPVHEVLIARPPGPGLTLLFVPGSVALRGAEPASLAGNASLAAVCYAVPALLALLAACAFRATLGWPALTTFALAAIAILALAELTPANAAMVACSRAHALTSESLPWQASAWLAGSLLAAAWLPARLDIVRGGTRP